jgi:hypothetical protein
MYYRGINFPVVTHGLYLVTKKKEGKWWHRTLHAVAEDMKAGGGGKTPPLDYLQQRHPKYKTHSTLWVMLQANGSILIFFVFSNNKTQKRILSANESPVERILDLGFTFPDTQNGSPV